MKTIQLILTFAALAALSAVADRMASQAKAAIIYDNDAVPNAATTSDATSVVLADDFMLVAGATNVIGVQWTGFYGSGIVHVDDDFMIQFFENAPPDVNRPFDRPQDLPSFITSIVVANSNRSESGGIFSYTASFAPLTLLPNTRYWVSIFNDASDEQRVWLWRQEDNTNNADTIGRRNQSNSWGSETGRVMDFQLIGEIPEPASFVLFLMGILATFSRRRCVIVS